MLYCGKSKAGSSVKTLIKTLVFSARFPTTKKKLYGAQPPSAATEKSLQAEKDFDEGIRGNVAACPARLYFFFVYIHFRFVEKNNVIASLEELRSIIFAAFRCSTFGCVGGHSKTLLLA